MDYDQDWEDGLYDDYEADEEWDGTYHFDDYDPSDGVWDVYEDDYLDDYDDPELTFPFGRLDGIRRLYQRHVWYPVRCAVIRLYWRLHPSTWHKCPSCGRRGYRKLYSPHGVVNACDSCYIPF